jgi:hypothetical protein
MSINFKGITIVRVQNEVNDLILHLKKITMSINMNVALTLFINTVIYTIFFISLFLLILPINPSFLQSGLSPSWRSAIDYFARNLEFGNDIIFTFGPLGSFWFPQYYYHIDTYVIAWFAAFLFIVTLFLSFLFTTIKLDFYQKSIALFAVLVGILISGTFIWFILPILLIGNYFEDYKNSFIKKVLLFFLLFFLAFSILIKFSHFPTAFISVFLIDVYNYIKHRKITYYSIFLFSLIVVLFVASGQNVLNFISYFSGSMQTLSGYSESMQVDGLLWTIQVFIFLSLSMLLLIAGHIIKYKKLEDIIFTIICALVIFMSFKNGFVRHDGHVLAAFSGITFTFGLLFIYYANHIKLNTTKYALITLVILMTIVMSFVVSKTIHSKKFIELSKMYKQGLYKNSLILFKSLSSERIKELNNEYKISTNRVKSEFTISDIKKTIDIYPWDQSYILANSLKYRPRPLFQSYSVYSPTLIKRNIDFLYSPRAADNILFSIKTIDNRLSSTMEGSSWLDIMSLYDIVDIRKEFLLLKKTKKNKSYDLKDISSINSSFGKIIKVPNGFVYIEVDIKKSFVDKIVNILYKLPILHIELTFKDGTIEKRRIIPGIISSGFILSPYIDNIHSFVNFSIGRKSGKTIKHIKFLNTSNCCYKNNIQVRFKKIITHNFNYKINTLSNSLKSSMFYADILMLNVGINRSFFNIETYKNETIVFSHVGTQFKIPRNFINDSLVFSFGIKEEAYLGNGKSDGACFVINKITTNKKRLVFKKCINPRSNIEDRKANMYRLNIDKNSRYIFEVSPNYGKNSAWGWSYWKFNGEKNEPK